ncbi:MAG: hypothetical protein RLP44_30295 [Aggregatilineales bacterium]
MMKTWKLWKVLQNPYFEHPIYQRFITTSQLHNALTITDFLPIPKVFLSSSLWGFVSGFALILFLCAGGWIVVLPALVAIPLIPTTGTLYGLFMAIRISGYVAREHQRGRFELSAVTPIGQTGVSWAICSAVYHRSKTISQLRDMVRGLYLVMYMVIGLLLMIAILNLFLLEGVPITPQDWFNVIDENDLIQTTLISGIIVTAFFVDFVQSIVTGSIVGMLTPTFTRNIVNARGIALGLFLMIQSLLYAGIALLCLIVLPIIATGFYWQNVLLLSALQLLTLYIIREITIQWLWWSLAKQLEADVRELNQATLHFNP